MLATMRWVVSDLQVCFVDGEEVSLFNCNLLWSWGVCKESGRGEQPQGKEIDGGPKEKRKPGEIEVAREQA